MTASLGGLVEHLELLQVLAAPAGLNVAVGDMVVHDPSDVVHVEPGDVVLGVGVDPQDRAAAEFIRAAGAGSAAAVVIKLREAGTPAAVAAAAAEAGVAVLGVSPDVAWGQLYTLLRTATASLGADGAPGPGGVAVGDLFTLANAVAAMVGGATTIESPRSVVLAYSSLDEPIDQPRRDTILGRRVPESWLRRLQEDGVFHQLWGSEDVVRIAYDEPGDFRPRLAIAVRAGGHILGSIWVAEGRAPFGPEAETALREAARIAALHLVRHQAGDDLERRRNSELLRSVLEGRLPPAMLAEPLNVSPHSFATVVAFQLQAGKPADLAVQSERVASLIALYAQAYRHKVACTSIGRIVYVLVTDFAMPDAAPLRRLATAVVDQSRDSLGVSVHAGVGATVSGLDGLLRSRHEADLVLRALTERGGRGAVAALADVQAQVILSRLRELMAGEPQLLTGRFAMLADLDAERHTCYLPTLRAYLDAFGDIPAAAASLNVHPNTYRYRLRRLMELAQLNLGDPVERLILHLQLHIASGGGMQGGNGNGGGGRTPAG